MITYAHVGEPGVPVLDATEGATEFRSSGPDDPALSPPSPDLHPGSPHAQGRLRVVSRIQGDTSCELASPLY